MNFDTNKNHFGFNQGYLNPVNKRGFGFKPLFATNGEGMEIPIEEVRIKDTARVKDI